jgi:hypothetical protein
MHDAKWVIDVFILVDLLVDKLILIIQAASNPAVIIVKGIILISVGNINISLVKNINQLMDLPAIIDIIPRSIVGRMIFICSLMCINEFERLGPHNTTKLNRTE